MRLRSLNLVFGIVLLVAAAHTGLFHSAPLSFAQAATTESVGQQPSDVTDEASLPREPNEREARLAKNMRYNGGSCHLTAGEDCFFDIIEPWYLPLIPLKRSTIAFVGEASTIQSYLSEDGTSIYTETTFRVEELFKSPANFVLSSDRTVVVDRPGGAIKMRCGRIVRDDTRDGFLGRPRVGMRYVFFADSIHEGKDFSMLRGYELRDGKVFRLTENGSQSNALVSNLWQEKEFLKAVRVHATKENRARLSSAFPIMLSRTIWPQHCSRALIMLVLP